MPIEGVVFEFRELIVGGLGPITEIATGAVNVSEDGIVMTLEVSCPGDRPYCIRGRRLPNGKYSGRHIGAPDDVEVLASWREGDAGQWEGTWRETPSDQRLLRFTFSLPVGRPLGRGNKGPKRLAQTDERKPGSEAAKARSNSPRRGSRKARVIERTGKRRTGGGDGP